VEVARPVRENSGPTRSGTPPVSGIYATQPIRPTQSDVS
jgi:hypothetical protein